MADNLQFTIWCPDANDGKTGGDVIPDLVIDSASSGQDFVVVTELGGLQFEDLSTNGVIGLKQGAAQARLYTINLGAEASKTAILDYLRILQLRGDSSDSIPSQLGNIYYRDEVYRIDPQDLINFRTSYGSPLTVGPRALVYHEAPCYLLFDGAWKRILGKYGETEATNIESADFAVLERINPISGEAASTEGTINLTLGSYSLSISRFSGNTLPRRPDSSSLIEYSAYGTPIESGPAYDPKRSRWPIEAELTADELIILQRMLALYASTPGSGIQLDDFTYQYVEKSPRTRAIATGSATDDSVTTSYWGRFNVAPTSILNVSPKSDDNLYRLIQIDFAERGNS